MWLRKYSILIFFSIAACEASFFAASARAALGEDQSSLEGDRKSISSATTKTSKSIHQSYTVQEITSGAVTVREYVAPNGIVFGIAWNGIAQPDLSALLGKYFGEYRDAMKRSPRIHGRRGKSVISGDNVTVERSGHMRAQRGRAYVSALVPEGVSIDDIR